MRETNFMGWGGDSCAEEHRRAIFGLKIDFIHVYAQHWSRVLHRADVASSDRLRSEVVTWWLGEKQTCDGQGSGVESRNSAEILGDCAVAHLEEELMEAEMHGMLLVYDVA
ncbi:hypothetical protein Scep_016931 [Stephania cephalantha]|uniref:Uncharacterized protein n=1 Tax=Stephania cephalantha TaxID=152367 RepID=A0AAP0NTS5_9MAGN